MVSIQEINCISIECVDDCDGFPGEVVDGDISNPIPSQHDNIERIASGDGHGSYSSVRPFQSARYENEAPAALIIDLPEDERNSPASLQEEEEEEEEEQEEEEKGE